MDTAGDPSQSHGKFTCRIHGIPWEFHGKFIWVWVNTYSNTIFSGMNIHFNPAILGFTARYQGFDPSPSPNSMGNLWSPSGSNSYHRGSFPPTGLRISPTNTSRKSVDLRSGPKCLVMVMIGKPWFSSAPQRKTTSPENERTS